MPHPVISAAERYRRQLLAQERQAATRLVRAYGRAFASLSNELRALEEFLAIRGINDVRGTQADIARLGTLRSLRAQVAEQVGKYAVYADAEIARNVQTSIELGLRAARGTVAAYVPGVGLERAIGVGWDNLASEAVETSLGFLADDSPLRTRLTATLGDAVASRVSDQLVDAIALGINPREVAKIFRREMGLGLTWSLTTARTAQLWSYREATRQSYIANRDVVAGWTWYSALDSRVCPACLALHGQKFGVDETLNGHHNCRCVAIPDVPLAQRLGLSAPQIESGESWLRQQPESAQREQLGPGLWDEWNSGRLPFERIAQTHEDDIYGQMRRSISVKEARQGAIL